MQSVTALSTIEAEYITLAEVVKEAIWLRGILKDLGIDQTYVSIQYGNQSAIHLSKHQLYHERSKHIEVSLHFLRDVISDGVVEVCKVHIEDNATRMLTKNMPFAKFRYYLDLVNCCEV